MFRVPFAVDNEFYLKLSYTLTCYYEKSCHGIGTYYNTGILLNILLFYSIEESNI